MWESIARNFFGAIGGAILGILILWTAIVALMIAGWVLVILPSHIIADYVEWSSK